MVIMGLLCGQYGVLCWWTVVWWALTSHNNTFEIILGWHHQLTWIDWWLRYLGIVRITWWKEAMMVKHKAKIRKSCRHPILKRVANRKYISRPISRTISIFTEIISRESVAFVSAKPCPAMPSHGPRTVAILAAAMSADDDVDTSEAHQVQAIQDIETSGNPRDFRESTEKTWGNRDASGPPLWRKNHCFMKQKSQTTGSNFF